MKNQTRFRTPVTFLCAAMLALSGTNALAQHGGGHFGGGAGGHVGGGGGAAHYAGGGYRGGYGYGGGYRGGYGGYGWRGGYGYGWRGGYYGGWGWGLGGLGLGLYFASLPLYYSTYYWGGIPYYYADSTYYTYDGTAGQYVTVAPPDGLAGQVSAEHPGQPAGAGNGSELMAYPKNGQTEEQQKTDKYECHRWAAGQSGFDPTQGTQANTGANKRGDYLRAQAACLEGRGYSVK